MKRTSRKAPVSDVFKAIADPTRRDILDLLSRGPRPVGDLARHFPVSRPAISRHLRVLRNAHVVTEMKRGNRRYYALDPRPLRMVDDWLISYRSQMRAKLLALKRFMETGSS